MSASMVDNAASPGSGAVPVTHETVNAGSSFAIKIVRDIRLLLIAVWLGASLFFSFVVAPTVFMVLPARELAGAVVSRTLGILNTGGFIIGMVLLVSAFFFRKIARTHAFVIELAALLLVTLCSFVGKWIFATQMQALRLAMGRPIDEVAQSDPLRIAFNSFHSYSVAALSVSMIAATISLLLIARRADH